jgi:hypothetical protein
MPMGAFRMDVQIDEGCDCDSAEEYGEKMDEGGRERFYRLHEDGFRRIVPCTNLNIGILKSHVIHTQRG